MSTAEEGLHSGSEIQTWVNKHRDLGQHGSINVDNGSRGPQRETKKTYFVVYADLKREEQKGGFCQQEEEEVRVGRPGLGFRDWDSFKEPPGLSHRNQADHDPQSRQCDVHCPRNKKKKPRSCERAPGFVGRWSCSKRFVSSLPVSFLFFSFLFSSSSYTS